MTRMGAKVGNFIPLYIWKNTRKRKNSKKEKKSDRGSGEHVGITKGSSELDEKSNVHFLHFANSDKPVKLFSLDVIISVGYRVKSTQGTRFRQWANGVLKAHLIKGYSINAQLLQISQDINKRLESHAITLADHESVLKEHSKKIDFFIQSSLPPKQGIFFDGQIYDAYTFVSKNNKKKKIRLRSGESVGIVDVRSELSRRKLLQNGYFLCN